MGRRCRPPGPAQCVVCAIPRSANTAGVADRLAELTADDGNSAKHTNLASCTERMGRSSGVFEARGVRQT
jgi:hypothetical protein